MYRFALTAVFHGYHQSTRAKNGSTSRSIGELDARHTVVPYIWSSHPYGQGCRTKKNFANRSIVKKVDEVLDEK